MTCWCGRQQDSAGQCPVHASGYERTNAERAARAERCADYWKAEHNAANVVIAAARAEADALRADIARHVQIAADLATECERLRAELDAKPIRCPHGQWCNQDICKVRSCVLGSPGGSVSTGSAP